MLLGQNVTLHKDHTNLIHPSTKFFSNRVLRQRLTLEEYGVTLKYIKATENVVADTLSTLPFAETTKNKEEFNLFAPLIDLHHIRKKKIYAPI